MKINCNSAIPATNIPQKDTTDNVRDGNEGFIVVGIVGSAIVLVIIALFFMARRTTKQRYFLQNTTSKHVFV